MAVPARWPPVCLSVRVRRPRRACGRSSRRLSPSQETRRRSTSGWRSRSASARRHRAAVPRRRRPEPQPPRRAGVRGRRRARAAAASASLALVIALHAPLSDPRSLPVVHPGSSTSPTTSLSASRRVACSRVDRPTSASASRSPASRPASFVIVNHVLLAVMLRLGRGHSFRESGLLSASGLGIEFVLAALGVAVAEFAHCQPVAPPVCSRRSRSHTVRSRRWRCCARARNASERCSPRRRRRSCCSAAAARIMTANRSAESMFGYSEQTSCSRCRLRSATPTTRSRGRRITAS